MCQVCPATWQRVEKEHAPSSCSVVTPLIQSSSSLEHGGHSFARIMGSPRLVHCSAVRQGWHLQACWAEAAPSSGANARPALHCR